MSLQSLQNLSHRTFEFWQSGAYGWAPQEASVKLESARLDWLDDLTNSLSIWMNIGNEMNNGELILSYANLGALVEGWLKLFYCIYYVDYKKNPQTDYSGGMIEPNDLKFERLKQFSRQKLWDDNTDPWEIWVEKIQHRRNAIHSFNTKDIGTPCEFLKDIEQFEQFIELISERVPYPDEMYP